MFSRYLDSTSTIMAKIGNQQNLADHMHNFAGSIRKAITKYGITNHPTYGDIYAFEVDGYGSCTLFYIFPTRFASNELAFHVTLLISFLSLSSSIH